MSINNFSFGASNDSENTAISSKKKEEFGTKKKELRVCGLKEHKMNSHVHENPGNGERGVCTYVWIDESGINLRSKTRTFTNPTNNPNDYPIWVFDGSSTGQADCMNSDVYISPVAIFKDPFYDGNHKIALCQTFDYEMKPLVTNHRHACLEILRMFPNLNKPWFGIEQEYLIVDSNNNVLIPAETMLTNSNSLHSKTAVNNNVLEDNRSHYCGIGFTNSFGRELSDQHLLACIKAGVNIYGTNAEVVFGQWEFQIGPCEGILLGDHLWAARYLLQRVAEKLKVNISYEPKFYVHANGSGAHMNFSTMEMRSEGGIKYINEAIEKLSKRHHQDILNYDLNQGQDNIRRLTGNNETSDYRRFTSDVANRSVSVRIPRHVVLEGRGYLEDRRPASNVDPYLLISTMVKTIAS
ncbi:hypothetical protein GJ496_002073 [Pomphorhynchus laevis]|nr:hypothetical protein GJ496_002073 [Pomphorhynchus laevis]